MGIVRPSFNIRLSNCRITRRGGVKSPPSIVRSRTPRGARSIASTCPIAFVPAGRTIRSYAYTGSTSVAVTCWPTRLTVILRSSATRKGLPVSTTSWTEASPDCAEGGGPAPSATARMAVAPKKWCVTRVRGSGHRKSFAGCEGFCRRRPSNVTGVLAPLSDLDLARRVLAGDESAFEDFFGSYFSRLYRFARVRLGGDEDAAEDIVQ